MDSRVINLVRPEGLSESEIPLLTKKYGKNILSFKGTYPVIRIIWNIVREPMFILLLFACTLYFILGNFPEAMLMAFAMAAVATISVYQETRSTNALKALEDLTQPGVTVVRDGKEKVIYAVDLVPGDMMILSEGMNIPADAIVIDSNDLSVNESAITGESFPVEKNETTQNNRLYQGTAITLGKCIAKVIAIGTETELGKIGKTIGAYHAPKTLLQKQLGKMVRMLAIFGFIAFGIILTINYLHYRVFETSLLFALTLAMSVVPEEIPVAFSSFMALGAYKMSQLGIISRQPQIIENLGTINVLCLDKTGTITENRMKVKCIYDHNAGTLSEPAELTTASEVLRFATLASESNPFDPMEKAIWEAFYPEEGREFIHPTPMIAEYPLQGQPPMMTHVYSKGKEYLAAGKGAAERVISICMMSIDEKAKVHKIVQDLAAKGYRVIGVCSAVHSPGKLPEYQDGFEWKLSGFLALYDPPKQNIAAVLASLYQAKVDIKLLTGDHAETAITIARQTGIHNPLVYTTGDSVMKMDESSLSLTVKTTNVFARMYPEAKLKVIKALQANGKVVAMTGDGINDAPALKASDIGIAMGKKGTETARQSADLVLTDDDLEKITTAVSEGRKIYTNLIKAIRYIISIHIPIIFTAALPVLLNWRYPNIFTPIHVIFLELIMGPTCSIFFEKEPVEKNNMQAGPRQYSGGLFTREDLLISVTQGLLITAGVLTLYYIFMNNGHSIEVTRNIVFTTLILSNIFLTFTNRSFTKTLYYTSRYKNPLAPVILIISAALLALLHFVPQVQQVFQLAPLTTGQFLLGFAVAFACVFWFEVFKMK